MSDGVDFQFEFDEMHQMLAGTDAKLASAQASALNRALTRAKKQMVEKVSAATGIKPLSLITRRTRTKRAKPGIEISGEVNITTNAIQAIQLKGLASQKASGFFWTKSQKTGGVSASGFSWPHAFIAQGVFANVRVFQRTGAKKVMTMGKSVGKRRSAITTVKVPVETESTSALRESLDDAAKTMLDEIPGLLQVGGQTWEA